ncbi:MAG: hypothetical protein ACI3ZP_01280 [Candidatus Cryptobacteroides sp.]
MELKDYTIEELRAELKRRNQEIRDKRNAVPRCRNCKHYGMVDYWGRPSKPVRGVRNCCQFHMTENGKNYRTHNASDFGCEFHEKVKE